VIASRIVSFAGSSVRIDCDGREAASVVDFLFRDFAALETPPHVSLEVRGADREGVLTLHSGDTLLYRGTSVGALARMLVERAAYHLSDRSAGGLLLHAAAVRDGDRCVLLPGKTGAGKSTLTAWLVARGYHYLTDELVYVPAGTTTIVPFPRPLNIRAGGLEALDAAGANLDGPGFERLTARGLTLVRVSPVSPVSDEGRQVGPAQATLLAFPRYQAGATFEAALASKAEAGLGLMGCLINARNLPEHGHGEVARLARDVPAFRVTYGDAASFEAWVHDRQ
jgi:hypothetical protein